MYVALRIYYIIYTYMNFIRTLSLNDVNSTFTLSYCSAGHTQMGIMVPLCPLFNSINSIAPNNCDTVWALLGFVPCKCPLKYMKMIVLHLPDVQVIEQCDSSLNLTIFRKPSYSGKLLDYIYTYSSSHATHRRSTFRSFVNRAFKICSE